MAGLDPVTQSPRVGAAEKRLQIVEIPHESFARTDVRALGGRLKAGHDELP